jgi:glycine C-acetyltransferase
MLQKAITTCLSTISRTRTTTSKAFLKGQIRNNSSPVWKQVWGEQLKGIEAANTYKRERIIVSPQTTEIRVAGQDKPVLNFCANNYLGLSDNAELISAAKHALDTHGFGLSSVRFICGTQDIHKQLERTVSQFHGTQDTILYGSCFDANGGIFEALLTPEDALFSDSLNHASIIDGIRLSKAQKYVYKHLDLSDLETKLSEACKQDKPPRIKLIVTDGAFSMDGDLAPVDKLVALARKYDALLFLDECHTTGFIGKTGRGTPEHFNIKSMTQPPIIINSTLGKALGGATGGYTTGPQEAIDLLRQRSRPYLFSNSLAPAIVGASLKMFDMLSTTTHLRDVLETNTQHFRTAMTKLGFTLKGEVHPIAPVMLGDAGLATTFANEMLHEGIYVIGFSFPVVPRGEARIRVQLSAAHTPQQIDKAITAFEKIGRKLKVI